jgi:hypothetical protein
MKALGVVFADVLVRFERLQGSVSMLPHDALGVFSFRFGLLQKCRLVLGRRTVMMTFPVASLRAVT